MNGIFLFILPEIFGLNIEVYFIEFIIAVPVFFFFNWLLKKFIKQNTTRRIVTWLTTLILVPTLYEVLISLFFIALFYEPNRNFNKTRWDKNEQKRFQMANSIINDKLLINKDTNEVKQMLGKPVFRNNLSKTWNYDMGMGGGGLGFLFHTLVIKFKGNKVISVLHQEVED